MKRKIALVFISLCCVALLSSFVILNLNEVNNQRDRIALSRSNGVTTRSATDIEIEASTDHKTNVSVSVMNFTGTAVVQIVGGRTSAQYYFDVNEMGYEVISIGTMRAGTYNLRITVGTETYEGSFDIVSGGRR
ncbi:MAG: DUF3244 domain-containing protein [Bacteroidia bacterium]|nr:DUF3244 domain-containing protein [Bacteroidia bacterium]